ncbi:MAG: magnesium transporter [Desulfobacterales bacterium]|nr:MAG: magnesium transporter [Desulfobacterales bacterium]
MNDKNIFLPLVEKFFEYDMEAASHIFENLPEDDIADVFQSLPPALAVRMIKHLQISFAAALLKDADDLFLREIVSNLDPQFAASILMHLPADARERMTKHVSGKLKEQIRELLEYPEDSIGRIMTTDFLSFDKDVLAHEAIEKIRLLAKKRYPLSYAYVTNGENRLIGVLNMRDLMIASPDKPLEDIIRKDVFSIHCFLDRQEAANELSKRKYFAAPVVDSENHMLGIIKAERLIQGVQEDITKDIQRMVGVGGDERVFSTIVFSLKKRLPWLYVNLATAFLAAAVVALFEGMIAKLTILAVFLPVVAGQGGNAGAQSLAVVMRGIVMREIPKNKISSLILKEGKLGATNGTLIGAVTALVAWLWYGNPYLGLVIGLGMLFNLIFAGLSGASIPLLMKRIGLDPAQSSSIILTTVTDVMGFIAFLGFAVLFQNFLV